MSKAVKGNQLGRENWMEKDSSDSSSLRNPFLKLSEILLKFAKHVAQATMQMVKGMAVMLNSLYKKLLSAILRSAFGVMLVMDFFADDLTLYLVNFFFLSMLTQFVLYVSQTKISNDLLSKMFQVLA